MGFPVSQSIFGLIALLAGLTPSHGMVYQPTGAAGMGDQWLFYLRGTHYLYHLYEQPAGHLHGVYLATSKDGVHFKEVGPVVEKQKDADWLGSGSVWRAGGRFLMNFSESRAHQSISFAESADLVHWRRLGTEFQSDPDPRWYEVNRWDCIWALPRREGGFWGYLSANPWRRSETHPDGVTSRSTGMLESSDGVHWSAIAPPVFEWGQTPEMVNVEVGAVRRFRDKYYLLAQTWGPYPGGDYLGATGPGVYSFIGDSPRGPFRPDAGAFRFLGNTRTRSTHFARFYQLPNEVLANHFLFTRSLKAWLAPLKKVIVDDHGHLRLAYWRGNDSMKGRRLPLGSSGFLSIDGLEGFSTLALPDRMDAFEGFILEGSLRLRVLGNPSARCGLYIEETGDSGTALLMAADGSSQLGTLKLTGPVTFEADDRVDIGLTADRGQSFRLLVRRYMMEFYIGDRLVQCYSLPERGTGRVGMVVQGGTMEMRHLKAWRMAFPEPSPTPNLPGL